MGATRSASVTAAQGMGPDTRVIELAMTDHQPLAFVGGQNVIVDAGFDATTGKTVKRAYSILSDDRDQFRFLLATMQIARGPGSAFMHGLVAGAEIKLVGPLGRLLPPENPGGRTLVLATDTGITAALGLVRGQRFASLLAATDFIWLRPHAGYFLPEAFVRAQLVTGFGLVEVGLLPPADHPQRIVQARAVLRDRLSAPGTYAQAFLAGDGAVNYAVLDDLIAAGLSADHVHIEAFFNIRRKVS